MILVHFLQESVGYDIYDVYDLGEFDQKGGVRTKYGTKEELLEMVRKAHDLGIVTYVDAVLNHKFGADQAERFDAVEVDSADRNKVLGFFPHFCAHFNSFYQEISDVYEIEVNSSIQPKSFAVNCGSMPGVDWV